MLVGTPDMLATMDLVAGNHLQVKRITEPNYLRGFTAPNKGNQEMQRRTVHKILDFERQHLLTLNPEVATVDIESSKCKGLTMDTLFAACYATTLLFL